ncbi:hypothetical protein SAMN06265377_0604 [Flagellimonas pacifica]|uniref:Uncharacterized protein n=1 Tax=Flagellimonas pacifica TaxID=1247520 RepID=A0A285ME07_9FLAO|nr:hypothetical protein SAMN06265377_0604 [Allomuricauda parva]
MIVNKLFSIILSFLVLLQSFGLHFDDLVQIDEFVEHAQFHSEQYGDNVIVFISKHYGKLKADHQKEHQEEEQEHEELPFQHQSHTSCLTDFAINTYISEFKAPEFAEFSVATFYYQASTSSLHSKGLFQPPRLS